MTIEKNLVREFTPRDDAFHPCAVPGAWEWWYFDAKLDNGYLMAGSFHFGSPRLPANSDVRFIEIGIYDPEGNRRMVRKRFDTEVCTASEEFCKVSMGHNVIEGQIPTYHIFFSEKNQGCDLTYESMVEGYIPEGQGLDAQPFDPAVYAPGTAPGWVVPQCRAKVSGTITWDGNEIEVSGEGYRDHNFAHQPLSEAAGVENVFWTKFYMGEWTLNVDAGRKTRKNGFAPMGKLILYKNKEIIGISSKVSGLGTDFATDDSLIPWPQTITMTFDEPELIQGEITCRVNKVLEFMDLHRRFKPFQKWFAETFKGKPTYRRYRYDYDAVLEISGEKVVDNGTGWCEHHKMI